MCKLPFDFVIKHTIGDGSCFLHAVLMAFNKTYIDSSDSQRRKMVRNLRSALSDHIEESDIYTQLARGELKEISKFVPLMDKQNMRKYINSNNWISYHFVELISKVLDLNIFIVTHNTNTLYNLGDDEIYYKKDRNSVFINYINQAHFETLGINTPDGIKTFFSPQSEIMKTTYKCISFI